MIIKFLASGFGAGYLPIAPGTWGTVVAVPLCFLAVLFGADCLLLNTIIFFFIGWYCSQQLTLDPQSDPDPSYIVIDEIAGLMLTAYLALVLTGFDVSRLTNSEDSMSFKFWILVFVSFRIFDITKPFPIYTIDEYLASTIKWRGFGVMIDDILAAIPAAVLVWGILTLI